MDSWVGANSKMINLLELTRFSVHWDDSSLVNRNRWYLIISNHQAWTDILILQICLLNHIPPIKFFTKRSLIWIPFLGLALWLLGFPFVRRSKNRLTKDTKSDRQITLNACQKFKNHPTSVLSFVEGTRFTEDKHGAQRSNYQHLLKPKVSGLSYVTGAMGEKIDKLLDITIVYPDGPPTFWEFLQGQCEKIDVYVRSHDLPVGLTSTPDDRHQRRVLAPWINTLWQEKDQMISDLKAE